jgi:hypothetical protein
MPSRVCSLQLVVRGKEGPHEHKPEEKESGCVPLMQIGEGKTEGSGRALMVKKHVSLVKS